MNHCFRSFSFICFFLCPFFPPLVLWSEWSGDVKWHYLYVWKSEFIVFVLCHEYIALMGGAVGAATGVVVSFLLNHWNLGVFCSAPLHRLLNVSPSDLFFFLVHFLFHSFGDSRREKGKWSLFLISIVRNDGCAFSCCKGSEASTMALECTQVRLFPWVFFDSFFFDIFQRWSSSGDWNQFVYRYSIQSAGAFSLFLSIGTFIRCV